MGLGIFIAKTLLEGTGARLEFANVLSARGPGGARVRVSWRRAAMEIERGTGDNGRAPPPPSSGTPS
jgi:two-component system sensor histidine kinase RegB